MIITSRRNRCRLDANRLIKHRDNRRYRANRRVAAADNIRRGVDQSVINAHDNRRKISALRQRCHAPSASRPMAAQFSGIGLASSINQNINTEVVPRQFGCPLIAYDRNDPVANI